jgi:hypothetical protein
MLDSGAEKWKSLLEQVFVELKQAAAADLFRSAM